MTTYTDQKGNDITVQVEEQIAEITKLANNKKIDLVSHGRIVAIFCAQTLDGKVHVGWHYAGPEDEVGTEFHYDHGVGIQRNTDGRYLWISPATTEELNKLNAEQTTPPVGSVYLEQHNHVSGGQDMETLAVYKYKFKNASKVFVSTEQPLLMTAQQAKTYREKHQLKESKSWDNL